MNTHADKTPENNSHSVANTVFQKQNSSESIFQFKDNRPEASIQRKLQSIANQGAERKKAQQLKALASPQHAIQKKTWNAGLGNGIIQRQVDQDNFPDFVNAQLDLQQQFGERGKDAEGKDNYTTVGYEHEFAQLNERTGLTGYSHQEIARTERTWPIKNQPFLIETDAANVLELVSPPFLIETNEERPVPLAEDVQKVDDFTKVFLSQMQNMTIDDMLSIFQKIALNFKLDPIVLHILSWTPGAERDPRTELSAEEVSGYRIKESTKGGIGVSSQWNIAMDAESIEAMQQGKPRVKNQEELSAHKEIESRLFNLAQHLLVNEETESKLGLFHRQFARSLAGIAYVPYIKEQKRRKEAANPEPVPATREPELGPQQAVTAEPVPGTMAAESDRDVRGKSSKLKDMNNVWLKEDLVTYAMKVLTPRDWAAISGACLNAVHDAITVAIIPDTMGVPVDKYGEVVDLLKRSVTTLNEKAHAISHGAEMAWEFPDSRAEFLDHNDNVAGARQDTFLPGDAARLPGRWRDTPLHVVEVREPSEDNFRLLDAVSIGSDAVMRLLEEWAPERRRVEQVRKLWQDIRQSLGDLRQTSRTAARSAGDKVGRAELFGLKDPVQLQSILDDLRIALKGAREARDRQETERALYEQRAAERTDERAPLIDEVNVTCWDQITACFEAIKTYCRRG